ncbi:MAG: hypothetical protein ACI4MH_01760 [Candidatus Coproplasma sp.]
MSSIGDLIEKAKAAKSPEELLEMAKADNIELSAASAAKYYAEFHKSGELSDDELDNVAGGNCYYGFKVTCKMCGSTNTGFHNYLATLEQFECRDCGYRFWLQDAARDNLVEKED